MAVTETITSYLVYFQNPPFQVMDEDGVAGTVKEGLITTPGLFQYFFNFLAIGNILYGRKKNF